MKHRRADGPHNSGGEVQLGLSAMDREQLAKLNRQLQVVRDRVTRIAQGRKTGVIITGRGGIGKSWTVVETLEACNASFQLHNSHMTPRALFDVLSAAPSEVHVFEDVEELQRNPVSLGLLRSATWGSRRGRDDRRERLICWNAHNRQQEVVFDGGVILVSNRSLSDMPEIVALATRISKIELNCSDVQIAALMRHVAAQGYSHGDALLEGQECLEVAEFVVAESRRLNRPLDMRMLINAFDDRVQADDHDSGCTWKDLVSSALRGRPYVVDDVEPVGIRVQKKARELELVRRIVDLPPAKRLAEWKQATAEMGNGEGASQATLYRRMAELGRIDAA